MSKIMTALTTSSAAKNMSTTEKFGIFKNLFDFGFLGEKREGVVG
jgi:hypothetical protein